MLEKIAFRIRKEIVRVSEKTVQISKKIIPMMVRFSNPCKAKTWYNITVNKGKLYPIYFLNSIPQNLIIVL